MLQPNVRSMQSRCHGKRWVFGLGACVFLVTSNPAIAEIDYAVVALTGDIAPGTDGATFSTVGGPTVNDLGDVLFVGQLSGPGVDSSNQSAIWSVINGEMELVIRRGDPMPGANGAVLHSTAATIAISNAGLVSFRGSLEGQGINDSNDFGLWSDHGSGLTLVARAGDAAPDAGGALFDDFTPTFAVWNESGRTAFRANLTGPGVFSSNNAGIWTDAGGTLALVARLGESAPNIENATFSALGYPVLNSSGFLVFSASVGGAGITESNEQGLWSNRSGGLAPIVRSGEIAPGVGSAAFLAFAPPVVNGYGQVAFAASLTGAAVDSSNNGGIWSEGNGSLALVARKGDAAPGTTGAQFSGMSSPIINGSGHVAFTGFLTGTEVDPQTNSMGIWSDRTGSLELVARMGDVAPGTVGATFFQFDYPAFDGAPAFNSTGQIVFSALLTGEAVDSTNDVGLWLSDVDGSLQLVAREGDLFDVNDDPYIEDLRTISFVSMGSVSGGEDGRENAFGDSGEFAYTLGFSDGTDAVILASIFSSVPGDVDGDGGVDVLDLDLLLANWGDQVGRYGRASGDLSGDGVVGDSDLNLLIDAWSNGAPPFGLIPEPGSIALFSLIGLSLLHRRR